MRSNARHSAPAQYCRLALLALALCLGSMPSTVFAGIPDSASALATNIHAQVGFNMPINARFQSIFATSDYDTPPGMTAVAAIAGGTAGVSHGRVSVSRAALYSLVLPGAGQWYAGSRGRAAGFLAVDGVIWAAFGFFETVGATKRSDYQVYARVHAGIDPTGKDDVFYRTITFYDSRSEYNDLARVFDPRKPYYSDTPYWHWQWDSDASRSSYRIIRNQSLEAFNRGKFAIGALVVNRLVAAIDAIRLARSVNRSAPTQTASWKIHLRGNPVSSSPNLAVTFSRQF